MPATLARLTSRKIPKSGRSSISAEVGDAMIAAAIDRYETVLALHHAIDLAWLDHPGDRDLSRWEVIANDRPVTAAAELAEVIIANGGRPFERGGKTYRVEPCLDYEGDPLLLAVDL